MPDDVIRLRPVFVVMAIRCFVLFLGMPLGVAAAVVVLAPADVSPCVAPGAVLFVAVMAWAMSSSDQWIELEGGVIRGRRLLFERRAAFAPGGGRIITGGLDGTVRGWKPDGGSEPFRDQTHARGVNRIAVSPDGRWVASVGRDMKVLVRDRTANVVRHAIPIKNNRSYTLDFSGDSEALLVGQRFSVDRYEVASGVRVSTIEGQSFSMPLAVQGGGGEAVVGKVWGRLVLHAADGTPRFVAQAHTSAIKAVAVSPDGRTIATGAVDGSLRLWHRRTGRPLAALLAGGPQVNGLAFSPAGRYLASCDHAGGVRLWPAWSEGAKD